MSVVKFVFYTKEAQIMVVADRITRAVSRPDGVHEGPTREHYLLYRGSVVVAEFNVDYVIGYTREDNP